MGALVRHSERWRPLVVAELERIGSTVPPELVLAAWWNESRGDPSQVNSIGATGLGQVLPVALRFYNGATSNALSIADLRGTSSRAVALQARVSIYLYDHHARRVAGWMPADADPRDLYMLGLLSYHQGWGAVRARLQGLPDAGLPETWESVRAHYPTGWRTPGARMWAHQQKNLEAWEELQKSDPFRPPDVLPAKPLLRPPKQAIAVVALLLALGGLIIAGASLAGGKA